MGYCFIKNDILPFQKRILCVNKKRPMQKARVKAEENGLAVAIRDTVFHVFLLKRLTGKVSREFPYLSSQGR